MNWFMWRQHRKQLLWTGAIVMLFAVVLTVLGAVTSHNYHNATVVAKLDYFHFNAAIEYLPLAAIALPTLLGVFWGAPLVAREYEENTSKLVWTQGITRRTWLSTKLVWMIGIAGLLSIVVTAAVMYCGRTTNAELHNHFQSTQFSTEGIVPVMCTLFAVALGTAVGAWLRKTVLAIAVTLGIMVALQSTLIFIARPHYMTPLSTYTTATYQFPRQGGEGVLLKSKTTGNPVPENGDIWIVSNPMSGGAEDCPSQGQTCTSTTTQGTTYQPADRYWKFQAIESVIYLILGAGAIIAAYQLVLKRDA